MATIITKLDVFTLVKLEVRAAIVGMTLEQYVDFFLSNGIEPITM